MSVGPKTARVAVALIALAGCSGSGEDAAPGPDGSGTTSATATTEATPSTSPSSTTPTTSPSTLPSTTPSTTVTTTVTTTDPPDTSSSSVPPDVARAPTIRTIIDGGSFQNLAHAGGDQAAPHSTRFAFSEAVRAGATALDLDVQLTSDGVLIVQHDDTVDKTTETTGPVADLTLAEIQALDNAYWFSPNCWPCQDRPVDEYVYRGVRTGQAPPPDGYTPDDFRVPTFSEIALDFPEMPFNIEIKGELPAAAAVAEQLAADLVLLDRVDSSAVVSFDDAVVDVFHDLAPEVAVSPGEGRLTEWFLNGAELEPYFEVLQLPPFQGGIQIIDTDVVRRIHDEGRLVWAWADDASAQENTEFYEVLIGYGVDGIIAGRPADVTTASAG